MEIGAFIEQLSYIYIILFNDAFVTWTMGVAEQGLANNVLTVL